MIVARMLFRTFFVAVIAVAFDPAIALAPLDSGAKSKPKVTAFFSAGGTCDGASSAEFKDGGPAVKVSLCVTSSDPLCGHTNKLQSANTRENGRFHITAATHGPNYPDLNSDLMFPVAITNPPAVMDFGATVTGAPVVTTGKQLLVTFDIFPQPNATARAYVINLAPVSSVSVGAGGACSQPTDLPIAATFKLIQISAKDARQ